MNQPDVNLWILKQKLTRTIARVPLCNILEITNKILIVYLLQSEQLTSWSSWCKKTSANQAHVRRRHRSMFTAILIENKAPAYKDKNLVIGKGGERPVEWIKWKELLQLIMHEEPGNQMEEIANESTNYRARKLEVTSLRGCSHLETLMKETMKHDLFRGGSIEGNGQTESTLLKRWQSI